MSAEEIVRIVYTCISLSSLLVLLVYCARFMHVTEIMRKDFIKSLSEHDKAVILSYKHVCPKFKDLFKKY